MGLGKALGHPWQCGFTMPILRRSLGYTSQVPMEPEFLTGERTAHLLVLNHTATAGAWGCGGGTDQVDRQSAHQGEGKETRGTELEHYPAS